MVAPAGEYRPRFDDLSEILPIQRIDGPVANRPHFRDAATQIGFNKAQGSNAWTSLAHFYVSNHMPTPASQRERLVGQAWPLEYGSLSREAHGMRTQWVLGDLGVSSLELCLEGVDKRLKSDGPDKTYAYFLPRGLGEGRLLVCRQVVKMLGDKSET